MKKRGQFFLIAALLISGVAIGLGTLYNTAYVERADTQVYDLSEELYAELQQTYDSGLIRGDTPQGIQKNIQLLARYYQEQNPDSTFIIFYSHGDEICKVESSGADVTFFEEGGAPPSTCTPLSSSPLLTASVVSEASDTRTAQTTRQTTSEKEEGQRRQEQQSTQPKPKDEDLKVEKEKKGKKVKLRITFKEKPLPAGTSPSAADKRQAAAQVIESPPFEIKPGNNFYFVIRKKVKNEQIIVYRQ